MADNAVDRMEAHPDDCCQGPANCTTGGPWWKSPWTWVITVCCLGGGIGIGWAIRNATVPKYAPFDFPPPGYGEDAQIMSYLNTMTVDEKIGQLLLADVQLVLDETDRTKIDRAKLLALMRDVPFGSVFNTVSAGWGAPLMNVDQWQAAVEVFHSVAEELEIIWPLFGIDTVHGANYVEHAAIFPHQLALAGSYNRTAATAMGVIGGRDTRAAGIGWTFGPILDLATVPGWSRNFETWGESPYVSGEMSKALLNGLQGENGTKIHENTNIAGCMKHFVAYAAGANGQDRGPVGLGDATVMNIYLKPYEMAMEVNPATIMSGFHCQNDDPAAGSQKHLKYILRDYLRYPGMMVTDYNTVAELKTLHHMVPTIAAAVNYMFKNTTTDVTMSAWDVKPHMDILKQSVADGTLSQLDLDVPAYRMLELKKKLGWNVDKKHIPQRDGWNYFGDKSLVGQQADLDAAKDATRQSVVLVKNDNNFLPLNKTAALTGGILVTGPSSDSMAYMSGGWTCHWQGCTDNTEARDYESLRTFFGNITALNSKWIQGVQEEWPHNTDAALTIEAAVNLANSMDGNGTPADYIVIGLGEAPYTERVGNIQDLSLPVEQILLTLALQNTGIPTILVLFEGRPRTLPPAIVEAASAILVGYWPGPWGGLAAGEIIVGDYNPSSTMSFGYPHSVNEGPHTHYHKWSFSSQMMYDQFHNTTDNQFCHTECWGKPLWEFGYGLSYTTFDFEFVSPANNAVFPHSDDVSVDVVVKVTNSGTKAGQWPVILFVSDLYRMGAAPEYKLVEAFDRVDLLPGASKDVTLTLTKKSFQFHTVMDPFEPPIVEPGTFVLRTGIPGVQEVTRSICIGACEDDSEPVAPTRR